MKPVGQLDYSRAPILMHIDSAWQVYRLRSCAKEPETVNWLQEQLQPGDCLYDIGANVGAYSLVAATIGNGAVNVIAFEPGFATFAVLCRNIELNGFTDVVTALPLALGTSRHLAKFEYSDISAGAARHHWSGEPTSPSANPAGAVFPTLVYPLDSVVEDLGLPPPTLAKVDVDGPELDVLLGAPRTLASAQLRSILVELEVGTDVARDVTALLEGHGFHIASRHPRGDPPLFNVIFVR